MRKKFKHTKISIRLAFVMAACCLAYVPASGAGAEWFEVAERFRQTEEGHLRFLRFREADQLPFEQFPAFLREAMDMGATDEYRLKKVEEDRLGYTHYHYQQYHAGIPVQYGIFKAHVRDCRVISMNGDFFPIVQTGGSVLTKSQALQEALAHTGATLYKWQVAGENHALRYATGDPYASYAPQAEIVYMRNDLGSATEKWRLCYKFDIYAQEPLGRSDIYVDAVTGEVIFENSTLHTADANGTAETTYSGIHPIVTDSTGVTYRLRETGRANGVETYNMLNGTSYNQAVDFTDADNYWANVNAQRDEVATDAHWGAEMTFDYFMQQHGRNSFDGQGAKLLSYVHYGQGYANAFWDGQRMTYGDGGGSFAPLTAVDICGHEFGHGVTGNSAGLVYQNESGALNESFSDIFGASIEFFAIPNDANWRIGEDIGGIRHMAEPGLFFDPDTYQGSNWFWGSADNGGVHTNSGVQNYWYVCLVDGRSGTNDNGDAYNVIGVGLDTAGAIAYRNLTVYLGAFDAHEDARFYAIESAIDLYGPCSNAMIQTMNAWHAVGVGPRFTGTLTAQFTAEDTLVCVLPASVSFSNQSTSAFGYFWDFGDGTTSTFSSPVHNYNQAGNYTVTLIVEGCNNTFDTIAMPSAVIVDPMGNCPFTLDWQNLSQTASSCEGELYDSGGTDNYKDGSNAEIELTSTNNTVITLNFLEFEYAAGDRVTIYDGPDALSPVLAVLYGSTLPAPVTSTGNVMTVKEATNGANNRKGFHATWSCAVGINGPDTETGRLEVFPNPTSGAFVVRYANSAATSIRLEISDMYGKVVRAKEFAEAPSLTTRFETNSLASGIYFVRITPEGAEPVTRKIHVQ